MSRLHSVGRRFLDEFSFVLVFLPVSVLPLLVMATVLGLDMRDVQAQRALLIGALSSMVCVFLVYRLYQRRLAERRLRAAMAKQARTDDLTGLGNRRSLMEELKREVGRCNRTGAPLAVLMVDLDRFKQVNDRFGHDAGDQVLQLFGHAARAATREDQDLLFRNGGDEFLVLLPETASDHAAAVGARLREGFKAAAARENPAYDVDCSVGVVMLSQGETPDALLQRADAAMYRAKGSGRGVVAS